MLLLQYTIACLLSLSPPLLPPHPQFYSICGVSGSRSNMESALEEPSGAIMSNRGGVVRDVHGFLALWLLFLALGQSLSCEATAAVWGGRLGGGGIGPLYQMPTKNTWRGAVGWISKKDCGCSKNTRVVFPTKTHYKAWSSQRPK